MEKFDAKEYATLARISMNDEEAAAFGKEFEKILEYVGSIESVDTEDITTQETINIFRSDEHPHESGMFTEDLLNAAPKRKGKYLKVKNIFPHGKGSKDNS
jgi:aspartyl/glutamyl-tRNA(Asn/Gln) amidotransferase C subunit